VRWLAITATLDVVVPGVRSVPGHAEVETVSISGVGHLGMLLSPRGVRRIVAALPAIPTKTTYLKITLSSAQ
jgi:triacylglycerol lipase